MKVQLLDLSFDDLEMVRAWRNSPKISSQMYTDNEITKDSQEKWFDKISKDETCRYWIIEKQNKKIGVAAITEINKVFNSCYWSFYIGDDEVRGVGVGAEVEVFVLNYVFDTLGLNKLRCEVLASNEKVIKMHEKFGFRREAYYRQHVKKSGRYVDVIGLAILTKEWKQVRDNFKNILNAC